MKGLKEISDKTRKIIQTDRTTWIELFYSFSDDAVTDTAGRPGYFKVSELMNYNTENDLIKLIELFKRS